MKFKLGDQVVPTELGFKNWHSLRENKSLVFIVVSYSDEEGFKDYTIYNENFKGHNTILDKSMLSELPHLVIKERGHFWNVIEDEIELAVQLTEEDML